MHPIYTAFYTAGTRYVAEADRLRRSLDRLKLDHDIRAIPDRGSWQANTHYTATHVCTMLELYPDRPVVQLDADAVVWSYPALFDCLHADADIAVHYRKGFELLNGTVYFLPTKAAKQTARRYRELIDASPSCASEQTQLAAAIDSIRPAVYRLPPQYCWIHDVMKDDLTDGIEPIIEHLQASRVATNSPLLPNRIRRLQEIEDISGDGAGGAGDAGGKLVG